jgi:hydroxyethylthiazole kinase
MHYSPGRLLSQLREESPLVHHITNWVTISACADLAKSLGASPVMAHAIEEAADMASLSRALVLNIGTLTPNVVESMLKAGAAANQAGIPITLDVCGAGATAYRNETCARLLSEIHVDIVKGNASEICAVAGLNFRTKGVDSGDVSADLEDVARRLSINKACVTVITGAVDIVAAPTGKLLKVENGDRRMASVVGTGCMAATAIGCFSALRASSSLQGIDLAEATAAALAAYECAAERAARRSRGPGSFIPALMDECAALSPKALDRAAKIRVAAQP